MKTKRGDLIFFLIILLVLTLSVNGFHGDDGLFTTLFVSTLSMTGDTNTSDITTDYEVQVSLDFEPIGYGSDPLSIGYEVFVGYIYAANIVEPLGVSECQIINESGNYALVSNTTPQSPCIWIRTSNITFDCQEFTIQGDGFNFEGLLIDSIGYGPLNNITIKNCKIDGFQNNINLDADTNTVISNLNISNVNLSDFQNYAIANSRSNNSNFENIKINGDESSIFGIESLGFNNTYNNLDIFNTTVGIRTYETNSNYNNVVINKSSSSGLVVASENVSFNNFNFSNNIFDVEFSIISADSCNNNFDNINLSDMGELGFFNNNSIIQNKKYSQLILCDASGSKINNVNLSHPNYLPINGLYVYFSNNIIINDVLSNYSHHGINLEDSDNITISNTNLSNNFYGLHIIDSDNNTLQNVVTYNTNFDGVYFSNSKGNMINNLTSYNNSNGINTFQLSDSTIINSLIYNNSVGLIANDFGINSPNFIFNNSFNNTININVVNTVYNNNWNTTLFFGTNIIGKTWMGGNFWFTPTSTGYSETCIDTDKNHICDVPYNITNDGKNRDFYPIKYMDYLAVIENVTQNITVGGIPLDNDTYVQAGENVTISANITDENPLVSVIITFWNSLGLWIQQVMTKIGDIFTVNIGTNQTWIGEVNYTINATDSIGQSTIYSGTFYVDDITFNVTIMNQISLVNNQVNITGISNSTVNNLSGYNYSVYFEGTLNQTNTFNNDGTFNFTLFMPGVKGNYSLTINTTKNNIYEEFNTWLIVDNIPYVTNLNITPQPIYTNDTATSNWIFNDIDTEDLNITSVEWFVNGLLVHNETTSNRTPYSILSSGNFTKHDNITINVTPYDGWIFGSILSYQLEIQNSISSIPDIYPTTTLPAYKTTNLTVNATNSTDADEVDGETLEYQYKFYLSNGTTLQDWSLNNWFDCYTNINCKKNDYVYILSKADDGENFSLESINTSIWINNTPPTVDSVSMLSVYTNETLVCLATGLDIDSDTLNYSYQFENASAIVQSWSSNNTFDCGLPGCNRFDNITCSVKADDGEANSTINNTFVTILNSPPSLDNITFTPNIFKQGANVTINTTGWNDIDLDQTRLECGNQTNSNNLCTSNYGLSNHSCSFINYWSGDSNHPIYCRLYDGYNYSNEITNQVIVDNTFVNITQNYPSNNYIEENSFGVTFEYTPIDANNIVNCSIFINNTLNQTSSSITNNSINTFDVVFKKGIYLWKIGCYDIAKNYNETSNLNFSINPIEKLVINPIGQLGVEGNENITTQSLVILTLKLIPTSKYCSYSNDEISWSIWENCQTTKSWELTTGYGEKTVYAKVNHTGTENGLITIFNDTITYSQTGAGTGTGTPSTFKVYDEGDYTNSNTTLSFSWTDASDEQTKKLGLEINYTYRLENTDLGTNTSWSPFQQERTTTIITSLIENHTYKLYVKAINPSGKNKTTVSDGIIIDTTSPTIYVSSNKELNNWTNNGNIIYNWTGTDSKSGIKGYSLVIDKNSNTNPDNIIDTTTKNKSRDLDEGEYYLHIKVIDNANNPSNLVHYGPFQVDKTPPTIPLIKNPSYYAENGKYNVSWIESIDELSNISHYEITIVGDSFNYTENSTINYYEFTPIFMDNYYSIIKVFDNAGNSISTTNLTTTPLKIIYASPNGTNTRTKGEPIIIVKTNKEAECMQTKTNETFKFNSGNYHETILKLSDGSQVFDIICEDDYGFKAKATINFIVVSTSATNIIITPNTPYYESQEIILNLTISPYITGIKQKDLVIKINGTKIPESDYSLNDLNDGNYQAKIKYQEKGTYDIEIGYDFQTRNQIINVNELRLSLEYESSIILEEESNILYSSSNGKNIGLAGEESIDKTSSGLKISIKSKINNPSYIFITTEKIGKSRNNLLKNKEFQDKTFSFGTLKEENTLRQIISPYSIIFDGLNLLPKGYYEVILINKGRNNNNKTTISIEQI